MARSTLHHLEGRERRLGALVAPLAAGPRQRLLDGVGGEQPEGHRQIEASRQLCDTARRLSGHEIEVRRLAAHHGTEADERVVPPGRGEALRAERQLEGPGHGRDIDRIVGHAVLDAAPPARRRAGCSVTA